MLSYTFNEFKEMLEYIPVDEKWSYLTKVKGNFYVNPNKKYQFDLAKLKNF